MSYQLKLARGYMKVLEEKMLKSARVEPTPLTERQVFATLDMILHHLEAQQSETPPHRHQYSPSLNFGNWTGLPIPEAPESETPSSPATETPAETSAGSTISFTSWCRVNLDGTLTLFPSRGMWGLVNSQLRRGQGLEVEIGVTLTSRDTTPPSGSGSSSPVEEPSPVNGVAGESEEWYPRYIIDCLEKCHEHTDSITGHLTLNSAISWMKSHYPAAALSSPQEKASHD